MGSCAGAARRAVAIFGAVSLLMVINAPTKASATTDYVAIIEDALIEGVEVPMIVAGTLAQEVITEVEHSTSGSLDRTVAALAVVRNTPETARVVSTVPTAPDREFDEILKRALELIALAGEDIRSAEAFGEGSRMSALDAMAIIEELRSSIPETATYLDDVVAASESLESVRAHSEDLRAESSQQLDHLTSARLAADRAIAVGADSEEYRAQVESAMSSVKSASLSFVNSELVAENLSASLRRSADSIDRALQALDLRVGDVDYLTRAYELVHQAQTGVLVIQESLPRTGDLVSSSLLELTEASWATEPAMQATLIETYRAAIESAVEATEASLAELHVLRQRIEVATRTLSDSLVSASRAESLDDVMVQVQLASLESTVSTSVSNLRSMGTTIDVLVDELSRLQLVLNSTLQAALTDGTTRAVIDALIRVFDFNYDALGIDFTYVDGWVNAIYDQKGLLFRTLGGVGLQVQAVVDAIDALQTQIEGIGWNSYDSFAGATGVWYQKDDCRVEAKQTDAGTVHVFYGGGGDDYCDGYAGSDVFHMRSGNDIARGNDGFDSLHMSAGEDEGRGLAQSDFVYGGDHADQIYGGYGFDELYDSKDKTMDHDYISGGPGSDYADMEDLHADDSFFGGDGNDPEPAYDKDCSIKRVGSGCKYDYFESAGGYSQFPPEP